MNIHHEEDQNAHNPKPQPHDVTVQINETPANSSGTSCTKKES